MGLMKASLRWWPVLVMMGLILSCGVSCMMGLSTSSSLGHGHPLMQQLLLQHNVPAKTVIRPAPRLLYNNVSTPAKTARLSGVAQPLPLDLPYHDGPLMVGPAALTVHVIWYGSFPAGHKVAVADFITSLGSTAGVPGAPSVSMWWQRASYFKDSANQGVPTQVNVGTVCGEPGYSKGRRLTKADVSALVREAIDDRQVPVPSPHCIYLLLTAQDVLVEGFCVSTCGYHSTISGVAGYGGQAPFIWVGNPAAQQPGLCAWPFAIPRFGPRGVRPLVPPNGDVGLEGMLMNFATLLAGTVTNPFNTGYFIGDENWPLEAVTACPGMFGSGHYPGYPGTVLVDEASGASYNAHGVNGRMFLLPATWNPATKSCETLI